MARPKSGLRWRGSKAGRVFDLNHGTTTFANDGWDDASASIYAMIAGHRGR
jgi:hypothetical protein